MSSMALAVPASSSLSSSKILLTSGLLLFTRLDFCFTIFFPLLTKQGLHHHRPRPPDGGQRPRFLWPKPKREAQPLLSRSHLPSHLSSLLFRLDLHLF